MSSRRNFLDLLGRLIPSNSSEPSSHPFVSWFIYFLAGFAGAMIIGWVLFPMVLYSSEKQPVDFSHEIHMDPDIAEGIEGNTELERCLYCHAFRKDGTFTGIPRLQDCAECHDDAEFPLGESAEEEEFLKEYLAKGKEIPWLSYSRQPDCVYFSHIAHVKMGDMECRTCHGDHGKSDRLPVYKKNRLTGYSIDIWGRRISGLKSNT
ncbi:MAG TPA: hypothetical protein ENH37_10805, partial [Deltaproteobacteria bacterium]|nr:hypothetical protein [Deltaproteobacteria bacterium]